MSKAEERALEAYPIVMSQYSDNCKEYDSNESDRLTFIEGYHQAEKDMELTWDDIRIILDAENDIIRECNSQKKLVIVTYPKGEDYYGEVLKRFKAMKGNTNGE